VFWAAVADALSRANATECDAFAILGRLAERIQFPNQLAGAIRPALEDYRSYLAREQSGGGGNSMQPDPEGAAMDRHWDTLTHEQQREWIGHAAGVRPSVASNASKSAFWLAVLVAGAKGDALDGQLGRPLWEPPARPAAKPTPDAIGASLASVAVPTPQTPATASV